MDNPFTLKKQPWYPNMWGGKSTTAIPFVLILNDMQKLKIHESNTRSFVEFVKNSNMQLHCHFYPLCSNFGYLHMMMMLFHEKGAL